MSPEGPENHSWRHTTRVKSLHLLQNQSWEATTDVLRQVPSPVVWFWALSEMTPPDTEPLLLIWVPTHYWEVLRWEAQSPGNQKGFRHTALSRRLTMRRLSDSPRETSWKWAIKDWKDLRGTEQWGENGDGKWENSCRTSEGDHMSWFPGTIQFTLIVPTQILLVSPFIYQNHPGLHNRYYGPP